jgi:hypothetical protein
MAAAITRPAKFNHALTVDDYAFLVVLAPANPDATIEPKTAR